MNILMLCIKYLLPLKSSFFFLLILPEIKTLCWTPKIQGSVPSLMPTMSDGKIGPASDIDSHLIFRKTHLQVREQSRERLLPDLSHIK